jgi:hypothetical protein
MVSVAANIFLYQQYSEERNEDFMLELYRGVSFAAREHKAEILDGISIEHSDEYWSKKFVEIRQRGSDRSSLSQQILVEYDNGETLVIDVAENYEHEYVVNDLFFLEGDGSDNE